VAGPLYAEVKARVLESLMTSAWSQDGRTTTEAELASSYGVSVGTVRKALNELVAERILVRQAGRGTFVARHDRDHMLDVFYNIVDADGRKKFPASELMSFRKVGAAAVVADRLRLPVGTSTIEFENLLRLNGEPVIHDRAVVPEAMFKGLDRSLLQDRTETIFGLYQMRFGVTVARLEEWLRAVPVPRAVGTRLQLKSGAPVLGVERVAQTYDGTPVEYRERYVNTAQHAYLNILGMDRAQRSRSRNSSSPPTRAAVARTRCDGSGCHSFDGPQLTPSKTERTANTASGQYRVSTTTVIEAPNPNGGSYWRIQPVDATH
jgi:GntR family transcriptional regulator